MDGHDGDDPGWWPGRASEGTTELALRAQALVDLARETGTWDALLDTLGVGAGERRRAAEAQLLRIVADAVRYQAGQGRPAERPAASMPTDIDRPELERLERLLDEAIAVADGLSDATRSRAASVQTGVVATDAMSTGVPGGDGYAPIDSVTLLRHVHLQVRAVLHGGGSAAGAAAKGDKLALVESAWDLVTAIRGPDGLPVGAFSEFADRLLFVAGVDDRADVADLAVMAMRPDRSPR